LATRASGGGVLCFVNSRYDFEQYLARFHHLAFFNLNGFEIPALQCSDIDLTPGMDLADIGLANGDVHCQRAGGNDLLVFVGGLGIISLHLAGGKRKRSQHQDHRVYR
jgi:hypothetical protein